MSRHTYSRCWIHLIWATHERMPVFDEEAARRVSGFLTEYAKQKGIYMRINFVNPEHVHALIDLPTNLSLEQAAKLLKGASSHWINRERVIEPQFCWQKGFGCFSVSDDKVQNVSSYIAHQREHHRAKSSEEEFQQMLARCGLKWNGGDIGDNVGEDEAEYGDDETVETVMEILRSRSTR